VEGSLSSPHSFKPRLPTCSPLFNNPVYSMKENELIFINPAKRVPYGSISASTPTQIAQAFADLRVATKIWQNHSVRQRCLALQAFETHLIDNLDHVSTVLNQNCGKPRQDCIMEAFITFDVLAAIIKNAPRWLARRSVPHGLYAFKRFYAEPVPYGIVAVIGPWNAPLVQVLTPTLAALVAGNVVLIKPSEVVPAVGALIEQLFAGVPELAPFVRVVHGGRDVGKAVVAAPPDLIFVTGSEFKGRAVHLVAAESLTPVITELGGKDAMIVLEDADIDAAAKWGVWAANYNAGQVCMSVERVYVVDSVYDRFVAAVKREVGQLKIGYTPDMESPYSSGPIMLPRQLEIIESQIKDALEKGAKLIAGGRRWQSTFFEPTVLTGVTHEMHIMRKETFGPCMPIMKVKDDAEAIQRANDSEYGLSASVWSQNLRRAERVGHQLEAGTIVVNDALVCYAVAQLPFGGMKKSGSGRIHGRDEVTQFTQLKGFAIGKAPRAYDVATILREPCHYSQMKAAVKLVFGNWRQKREAVRDFLQKNPTAAKYAHTGFMTAATLAEIFAILFVFFFVNFW